jgi:hypothetical protein
LRRVARAVAGAPEPPKPPVLKPPPELKCSPNAPGVTVLAGLVTVGMVDPPAAAGGGAGRRVVTPLPGVRLVT